ncbi:alpha/beta hydrolase [Streptomyces sp. NBC_01020]|uniref:alpha/beta fold hydrolase n=1 Tax=Streptomyces sp. NBC_01020 TaxID=2903722 RepID=UPI00386D9CEB|nr:alpha/beta hydrolase [Streptomyces sp. NBC_01020]
MTTATTRHFHTPDGIRLAYIDLGGAGRPVLALHGAYGRGRSMLGLATHLGPGYRLIALDQRGHGLSDHPDDYGRDGYIADAAALVEHLGLGPVAAVGHSLGGITAYQLAARRPELVSAVVVLDFPAEYRASLGDDQLRALPTHFPSMCAMLDALAFVDEPRHFTESAVEEPEGWRFLWRADEIQAAKAAVRGDWWDDFTGAKQPLMVVRGRHSAVVPRRHAEEMIRRRPGTEVVTIDGHHDFYITHQAELGATVRTFLDRTAPLAG